MSAQRSSVGSAGPAPQPVSVSIERLVLDGFGFTSAQGAVVQRALEHELARLVHADAGRRAWRGGALSAAAAPAVQLAGHAQPASVGQGIARSLFAALGGQP